MTRRSVRLFGLVGVGVVLVGWLMTVGEDVGETVATPQLRSDGRATATSDAPVVDVNLEALQQASQEAGNAQRNLFRFEVRQAEPPQPAPVSAPLPSDLPAALPPPTPGPVGPPPPPPIPVKFIGAVDGSGTDGQVVYFSDGRGRVFFGREGDIIEGQYRVLTVSPDSAELAYLDGRGRQTIRLSGQ